jgi:hypothetical protein
MLTFWKDYLINRLKRLYKSKKENGKREREKEKVKRKKARPLKP